MNALLYDRTCELQNYCYHVVNADSNVLVHLKQNTHVFLRGCLCAVYSDTKVTFVVLITWIMKVARCFMYDAAQLRTLEFFLMKRAKYFIIAQNYRKMTLLFDVNEMIAISCQTDIYVHRNPFHFSAGGQNSNKHLQRTLRYK